MSEVAVQEGLTLNPATALLSSGCSFHMATEQNVSDLLAGGLRWELTPPAHFIIEASYSHQREHASHQAQEKQPFD